VAGNIHASQAGVNVPASALANGAFSIYSWGPLVGASFFFDGDYYNVLRLGASTPGDWPQGALLRPEEAFNLDTKADDGLPAYGVIRAPKPQWQANCATTNVATTATYHLLYRDTACMMLFMDRFMAPQP
jgi:hypothetical protein